MNKQQNNPVNEQAAEQVERRESVPSSPGSKKQFIEPVVSVPVDVLEATSFFQTQTTLDTSDV
ncbi:MAG: hypothetical protein QOF61_2118 [Acidobacteriota bacterium]|nr:hypothetical protein [Acidobacteriota bacterium]